MSEIADTITEMSLRQFTGTERPMRHPICRRIILSDGAQFLMNNGAGWLIDAVASHVQTNPKLRTGSLGQISFWKLIVSEDRSCKLICQADTGRKPAVTQDFIATDFPLDEVTLYVAPYDQNHYMIYLPSEH